MAVRFEMATTFGTLKLGAFPTNEEGKAVLALRDRRFGVYAVRATFDGDEEFAASETNADVDFGARPPPSLPSDGVLITPYPTYAAALPFLVFYGTCWLVFLYAFGWLVFWKMRRADRVR